MIRSVEVAAVALLAASFAAIGGPSGAQTQAVTTVIGSKNCPAGQAVHIQAQTYGPGYIHIYFYWPSSRTSPNYSANTMVIASADTTLQSTSWKVTAVSLGPVSDYCA